MKLSRYAKSLATIGREVIAAGMSRSYDQMANGKFALIAAATKDRTPEQNEAKMYDLKSIVAGYGYGFVEGVGIWEGGPKEPTIFVPGISDVDALKLGRTFDQKAVWWGDEGVYYEISCVTGGAELCGRVADHFKFLGKKDNAEKWDGPDHGFTELDNNRFTLVEPRKRPVDEAQTTAEREEAERTKWDNKNAMSSYFFHRPRPVGAWMGTYSGYRQACEPPTNVGDFLVYLPQGLPAGLLARWKQRRAKK